MFAQNETQLSEWLKTKAVQIQKPAFAEEKNINGKTFSNEDLLKQLETGIKQAPEKGKKISLLGSDQTWEAFTITEDSIILPASEKI